MSEPVNKSGRFSRRAVLAALGGVSALGAGAQTQNSAPQSAAGQAADVQLVLAVDASGSVSQQRFLLQKRGYVDAFRNPRVLRAIQSGLNGGIGVTMYQWTGPRMQVLTVPWRRAGDAASCEALAKAIDDAPRLLFGGGTSISGAIDYGAMLFANCPFPSSRMVIDVSGDGTNTSGRPVRRARDDAVKQGIIINGLPILAVEFELDRHFDEEVIGGAGAFMIAAKDFESFGEAVARKLVQEISAVVDERGRG